VQGRADGIDTGAREIALEDGSTVNYDWLVVGVGSRTAFFGIDGLEEHALTLKSLDDVLGINEAITEAAREATREEPAQVVVGGAGLSGIQSAGEIAEFRDRQHAPIDIHLVEGLDSVFPPGEPELQGKLDQLLRDHGVNVMTGEFITEVDEETVYIGKETELDYDVLLWTGGITGRDCAASAPVETDERSNRLEAGSTFRTSDDRVFALGDTAMIDQPDGEDAPPTAQAAWQAAKHVGENVRRGMNDQPLKEWTYDDKGTLISVGDEAVAYDAEDPYLGLRVPVRLFSGFPAEQAKKFVAARWIRRVAGPTAAARAYPDM
jgi:NADH dehydrogenase